MATATNQLLQRAGTSTAVAAFGDNALGMATTMGGAACARAAYAGTNWAIQNYRSAKKPSRSRESQVFKNFESSFSIVEILEEIVSIEWSEKTSESFKPEPVSIRTTDSCAFILPA